MRPLQGAARRRSAAPATALRASPLQASTVSGLDLAALLDELDGLGDRCAAPATARAAWIRGTLSAVGERDPWAVVVRDERDELRAAAVLLEGDSTRVGDGGRDTVTLAGCAMGHRSAILADGAAPAALLGHALGETLMARDGLVRVQLGPIETDLPWLSDFVATFPGAEIVPTDPIPMLRRMSGSSADEYLSPAIRRTLRKAANRAAADRKQLFARITSDTEEIEEMLPEIEQVHRERDHAQGRRSELDDSAGRRIWRARVCSLAATRQLELATLHIDGNLAAHVLAILEPSTYRVLEGNIATRWARYAPGRVLETAVLQRLLDLPALTHLDWMTAVAPDRLLAANDTQPVSVVRVDYQHGHRT